MSMKDIFEANTDKVDLAVELLGELRTPTGNYIWKTYDKNTLEFTGYTLGGNADDFPTAGAVGYTLYVLDFRSIEELTWSQINEVVHSGYAETFLSLKDSKKVTLTTGEKIELEIVGFNHDTYTDGGTAPVSFFMKNCLNAARSMNSSNTNVGGWDSTAMYTWLQGEFFEQLPEDLKSLVKSVDKLSSEGNQSATIETIPAKIWQLSYTEAFSAANSNYSPGGEGELYPVFTDNASRIKMRSGSASYWWLRSPIVSTTTSFCFVNTAGAVGGSSAGGIYGVAVGLCI